MYALTHDAATDNPPTIKVRRVSTLVQGDIFKLMTIGMGIMSVIRSVAMSVDMRAYPPGMAAWQYFV